MLLNLHVKNLALIDEIEVEFGDHLNILTGETGAGKSILLGSMNAALGNKISKDMIRPGADHAYVELLFHTERPEVLAKLADMDIPVEEGEVLVSRKIMNRRNICKVNERTVTVSKLKEISSLLIDIHSQHEHQSLLHRQNHLKILDEFSKKESEDIRSRVQEKYQEYSEIQKQLEEEYSDQEKMKRELDFISYQIAEIQSADLLTGEDEDLEHRYRKMVNGKKIMENLAAAYQITGYDDTMSAGSQIGNALHELISAEQYDEDLSPIREQLETVDSIMNDFNRDLSGYISEMEFDEQEFYEIEQRLNLINTLKSKYGATIEDIEQRLEELEKKRDHILHFEENRAKLLEKLEKAEEVLRNACQKLTKVRKKYARKLSSEMTEALKELNFLDVQFMMQFQKLEKFTANGFDEAVFLISTNPGLPMRPLNEVASGGELSRIMLAIKSVLADVDQVDTLIFDEIDSGISGRTAQKVSEKMVVISDSHQVIAITHLPQIAAMADNHYLIEKQVEGTITRTVMNALDHQQSVQELARMLGGVEVTDAVMESAREMKELAEKTKGY
ncbi:MAG: DNA repair protein RecN [Lachnospiraceae bacterium]|nr:DNA repair protein RecN [Lachnospiraceae bacterium]